MGYSKYKILSYKPTQKWHMSCVVLGKGLLPWCPWLPWPWYHLCGGYHGGMNICGSNASHPNDPTRGLNVGPPSGFLLGEFAPCEYLSCPPFGGWWTKLLCGTWIGKLSTIWCISILMGIIIVIEVITCC